MTILLDEPQKSKVVVSNKRILSLELSGPAFWQQEIERCHKVLDEMGVPREKAGAKLTLSMRLAWMAGMLASARAALRVIVIAAMKRMEEEA